MARMIIKASKTACYDAKITIIVTYLSIGILVALDADSLRDALVAVCVVMDELVAGRGLVLQVGGLVNTSRNSVA